jgi:hypothetical protein
MTPARLNLLVVTLCLFACGCTATFPAEPTSPAPIAALVIHFPQVATTLIPGVVTSTSLYEAYAVDRDGVYQDVTTKATWSSSNNTVLRQIGTTSQFTPAQAGDTEIHAVYQNLAATLPVNVRDPRAVPYLQITTGSPRTLHSAATRLPENSGAFLTGAQVTWTTSDERVATMDNFGRLEVHAPGNVRIIGTYSGLVDWYWTSFPPRTF